MITRRTARFARLAHSVEETCHRLGIEPDPAAVDQALNDLPEHLNLTNLVRPADTLASLDVYRPRKQ